MKFITIPATVGDDEGARDFVGIAVVGSNDGNPTAGEDVGLGVAMNDGVLLIVTLGAPDGDDDGLCVGDDDALIVGMMLGYIDGGADGVRLTRLVGLEDGVFDGLSLRVIVGLFDRYLDGNPLG